MSDSERLDWLESVMRPASGYVEVYLAGLRRGAGEDATAFQCELQGQPSQSGPTLRDAIDAARGALRCTVCGWPLKDRIEDGCTAGSCSERKR